MDENTQAFIFNRQPTDTSKNTINACLLGMIANRWKKYEEIQASYKATSFTFDVMKGEINVLLDIFKHFNPDFKTIENKIEEEANNV